MKRILIVDDDVTICKLVAAILEDEYEVSYATELEAAQRTLARNRFDLIIADYFLGAPEGEPSRWPLGEACRALAPETPIVALTGLDPSLQGVLRDGGAKAIISKPFDMDDLLGTIDHAISQGHLNRISNPTPASVFKYYSEKNGFADEDYVALFLEVESREAMYAL